MSRKDDASEPREQKRIEPGKIPPGRIGVYDGRGRLRGHVGHKATAVTAERFGAHNAELQKKNGAFKVREAQIVREGSVLIEPSGIDCRLLYRFRCHAPRPSRTMAVERN